MNDSILKKIEKRFRAPLDPALFVLEDIEPEDRSVGIFGDAFIGSYSKWILFNFTLEEFEVIKENLNCEFKFSCIEGMEQKGIIHSVPDKFDQTLIGWFFEEKLEGYIIFESFLIQERDEDSVYGSLKVSYW